MNIGHRHRINQLSVGLTALAAALIVAALLIVIIDAIAGGWGALSWRFFTEAPGEEVSEGGVFPAI